MTPVQQQFEVLRTVEPQASLQPLPDGSHLITIPAFALPDGWSMQSVEVKFIAPVGYPLARPDCFWTNTALRLKSGAAPINTGPNQIPHNPNQHLWFSWHVGSWNPNVDNLVTYWHVVKRRLRDPR